MMRQLGLKCTLGLLASLFQTQDPSTLNQSGLETHPNCLSSPHSVPYPPQEDGAHASCASISLRRPSQPLCNRNAGETRAQPRKHGSPGLNHSSQEGGQRGERRWLAPETPSMETTRIYQGDRVSLSVCGVASVATDPAAFRSLGPRAAPLSPPRAHLV